MEKFAAIAFVIGCLADVQVQNQESILIKCMAPTFQLPVLLIKNLRTLTKQIGARLSGLPQLVKAEQLGVKAVRDVGDDSVMLQQCLVPDWVVGGNEKHLHSSANHSTSIQQHWRRFVHHR